MSKRLFVAIDLPNSTRKLLAGLDPHLRGVRWTELDQMHLTLGFFGDVPEDIELKLREKLSAIGFGAFFLPVNGVGCSPQKARRKLSGSASAKRTRICSKFTSACRKPRWPSASNRSFAPGIRTSRCALPRCLRSSAPEILTIECRVRRWNDPRRRVPSLFQQPDACGANSYSRTYRSL
jgi:2''-5'' RNA ligase